MYDAWKEGFYGKRPKRTWLNYIGECMTGVEVDATFYRQQKRETYERWASEVPPDFKFAVRGHRYISHRKKLVEPEEPLKRVREQAEGLGPKLGVMLWQLPPFMRVNVERLRSFGEALQSWTTTRHAMEFRHESWFTDEVAGVLSQYNLANTISDAGSFPIWQAVTTDFVYVRLHGNPYTYASRYEDPALDWWAIKIRQWLEERRTVHVYFDNDAHGHAPHDALRLLDRLR